MTKCWNDGRKCSRLGINQTRIRARTRTMRMKMRMKRGGREVKRRSNDSRCLIYERTNGSKNVDKWKGWAWDWQFGRQDKGRRETDVELTNERTIGSEWSNHNWKNKDGPKPARGWVIGVVNWMKLAPWPVMKWLPLEADDDNDDDHQHVTCG